MSMIITITSLTQRIISNKLCSFIDAGVRFDVISFRVTSHCPTFIMMNYVHTCVRYVHIYIYTLCKIPEANANETLSKFITRDGNRFSLSLFPARCAFR